MVSLFRTGRANSLFGDGVLTTVLPEGESFDTYTNDPSRPAPFITEASFAQIGSTDDYRAVERRDDVLVYTSGPVSEDVQICGPITARLMRRLRRVIQTS